MMSEDVEEDDYLQNLFIRLESALSHNLDAESKKLLANIEKMNVNERRKLCLMSLMRKSLLVFRHIFSYPLVLPKYPGANTEEPHFEHAHEFISTAIEADFEEGVKFLIEHGIVSEWKKSITVSPLYIAIKKEKTNMVKFLLKYVVFKEELGKCHCQNIRDPIMMAAYTNNLDLLKILILEYKKFHRLPFAKTSILYACVLKKYVTPDQRDLGRPGSLDESKDGDDEERSLGAMKLLVSEGADVNFIPEKSVSLLSLVVCQGFRKIVDFLLDKGIDMRKRDDNGRTAFYYLFLQDNYLQLALVRLYESSSVSLTFETPDEKKIEIAEYLIRRAIGRRNFDWFEDMFPIVLRNTNKSIFKNFQSFFYSIVFSRCSRTRKMKLINTKWEMGASTLMLAARFNNLAMVKILMEYDADAHVMDESGLNVLTYIVNNEGLDVDDEDRCELLKYFIELDVNVTSQIKRKLIIRYSLENKLYECFKYIVGLKACIQYKDFISSITARILAKEKELPKEIFKSVEFSLKAMEPDHASKTPLMVAAYHLHTDYVKFVIENTKPLFKVEKVDTNIQSRNGYNVLHTCILGFCSQLFHQQVDCGSSYYRMYVHNYRQLRKRMLSIVDILLDAGTDVNAQDIEGGTPLMYAFKMDDKVLLKKFLEAGARVDVIDFQHKLSCLQLNILSVDFTCLSLMLRQDNSDSVLELPNKDGETILQMAIRFPLWWNAHMNADIVRCLVSKNCSLKRLQSKTYIGRNTYGKVDFDVFNGQDRDDLRRLLFISGAPASEIISTLSFRVEDFGRKHGRRFKRFAQFCGSRSLKCLCRRVVRQCIGVGLKTKMQELEIPETLYEYLLLEDEHSLLKPRFNLPGALFNDQFPLNVIHYAKLVMASSYLSFYEK